MNFSICDLPVVLVPSAQERAAKDVTGKPASYYTAIFDTHADCTLKKRAEDVEDLIRRLNNPKIHNEKAA